MLFRKNIEPSCSYCVHGNSIGESSIACLKKGVVNSWGKCSRFSYDPLKRIPPSPCKLNDTKYTEEDFKL